MLQRKDTDKEVGRFPPLFIVMFITSLPRFAILTLVQACSSLPDTQNKLKDYNNLKHYSRHPVMDGSAGSRFLTLFVTFPSPALLNRIRFW